MREPHDNGAFTVAPAAREGVGRAMTIGEAAETSGVTAKLIRYYESIHLIRAAARTEGGYRVYTDADVQTLRFIKRARSLGFSIKQIERLLALWHDRSRASTNVRALALAHVVELEEKIHELQAMAETLRNLAVLCQNDEHPDCPILADLDRREQPSGPAARSRKAADLELEGAGADGPRHPHRHRERLDRAQKAAQDKESRFRGVR